MNRFLGIALAMLFVLGLVVVDYVSATELSTSGSLRFRGEYKDNVTDFNDDVSNTSDDSYYDGRVRLAIDANVSDKTTGRIHLESGSADTSDTYKWATQTPEGKGIYGEGNSKRGELRILEAWIQHKGSGLIGTPAGIKIGHMPLKLGNGLFFNHSKFGDDAIVLFADPTKELHIALLTAKLTEGTPGTPDDTDLYVGLFTYKVSGVNVSGDVTYLDDQDYSADGLHFWNFGLRGDTKVGGLGLKADVELQSGKAKGALSSAAATATNITSDAKFKGYAVLLGANYTVSDITLDAEFALGSGDKDRTDSKVGTFVTALSGSQNYTYVYDYRAATAGVAAQSTTATSGATGTGLANTTYYKIGATAKPAKDLSANLNLYLLKATKAVSTSSTYDDKGIGTELDGKLTYQIDKNLVYFVEGGYLWAGDFYKNVRAADVNPDNAYAVRHGVELTF
jgi:hypothetical protein